MPKFKWIGFAHQALWHPDWSDARQVADMKRQIDRALELGYDVLISQQWELDEPGLAATIGTLSNQSHAGAIWRMLHARYHADKAFDDALGGRFYHLRRNP